MTVTVNGSVVVIDDGTTVAGLLDRLGLPTEGIAVAVDAAVVPRSQWSAALPAGACVEVVTAVQGG